MNNLLIIANNILVNYPKRLYNVLEFTLNFQETGINHRESSFNECLIGKAKGFYVPCVIPDKYLSLWKRGSIQFNSIYIFVKN